MSSVSLKGEESKGQEKKDEHKKRKAEGQPSWHEKAVTANFKEEEIDIPKRKGEDSPDRGSWEELTFIPEDFMAKVIGKNGMNLKKIEAKTKATLKVSEKNSLYIKGSPESKKQAIREIKETMNGGKEKYVAKVVHVDTAHLEEDHEFKLSIAQPPLSRDKCFKLKLQDDPLKGETPSGFVGTEILEEEVLRFLKQIHKKKEEEMVMVVISCYFGHAYLIKVDEDEEDDIFTPKEVKARIESKDDDRWETIFRKVETIEVEQTEKSLKAYACTASDDLRYDLTFLTPSGLEFLVKVWLIEKEPGVEGASASSLAFRRSPQLSVRNTSTEILHDDHSGDASNAPIFYISDTFNQQMTIDILSPSAGFDCRLKIRTFPKFPQTKPQAEKERKLLENYLMKMRIDDGQLKFPPISELPDGFDLSFQRRCLRKTYRYEHDGDAFTLTVSKDQLNKVNADQTDAYSFNESEAKPNVHLNCEEWDQVLNEGNWEPEQITAKLPKFLQFLRKVQGNVAPL
ncbi:uncharacterized protein [Pocillopora verrucosa]|uniref:uncharacterized protein isoform X3 n=1 Tax=Pocillopora verrucosa TaxID=203993 RepID=UPI003341C42C